jgi:HK97 family phage prohead protease
MKKTLMVGAALAAALLTRESPPPGVTHERGTPPPSRGERFMAFTGSSYDPATRECDATFATGEVVSRWYGTEQLQIDTASIILRRVALNQCRLLFGHDSRQPIGLVISAEVVNGQLVGRVRFAETPQGDLYAGMVQRGELTGISVGYNVLQWTLVSEVDADSDAWTATRWELMEVSLVTVPADPFAGVRSAEPAPASPPVADPGAGQRSEEEKDMLTIAQVLALRAQARALGVTAEAAEAVLTREGITHAQALEEIMGLATAARAAATAAPAVVAAAPAPAPTPALAGGLSTADALNLRSQAVGYGIAEDTVDAILSRQNITRPEASEAILTAAASAQRAAVAPVPAGGAARVTVDEREVQAARMTEALAARMGNRAPDSSGREFMGWSVLHMWAERAGIDARDPVRIYDTIARNFGPSMSVRSGAMMTTADFPLILEGAANQTLMAAYNLQQPSYRNWAAKKQFQDFRPHHFYRIGDFPELLPLGEGGEIKAGSFKESKESAELGTSARLVMMTRPMLINDNLNAFGDFAGGAGRSAARRENLLAYTSILSNAGLGPTMSDGKTMFHADHGNLAASGTAITEDSLSAAREAGYVQKDLDGHELNIDFPILLLGPKKLTEAEKLLIEVQPTKTADAQIFAGKRRPVADAKIKDKAWWNLGDPANGESNFVFGYLRDQEAPELRQDKPFNYDGIGFGVIHDFGFGANEYRFGYKNAGDN